MCFLPRLALKAPQGGWREGGRGGQTTATERAAIKMCLFPRCHRKHLERSLSQLSNVAPKKTQSRRLRTREFPTSDFSIGSTGGAAGFRKKEKQWGCHKTVVTFRWKHSSSSASGCWSSLIDWWKTTEKTQTMARKLNTRAFWNCPWLQVLQFLKVGLLDRTTYWAKLRFNLNFASLCTASKCLFQKLVWCSQQKGSSRPL